MLSLRSSKTRLLFDRVATSIITVVGLTVIVAVFGMMAFLLKTVLPLGESEDLQNGLHLGRSPDHFSIFHDDQAPLVFGLTTTSSRSCEFFLQNTKKTDTVRLLYPKLEPGWESSLDLSKGWENLKLTETKPEGIEKLHCYGVPIGQVILTVSLPESPAGPAQVGAYLLELESQKTFLQDSELLALSDQTKKNIMDAGVSMEGSVFFGKKSVVSPVFKGEPVLKSKMPIPVLAEKLRDSLGSPQPKIQLEMRMVPLSSQNQWVTFEWKDPQQIYHFLITQKTNPLLETTQTHWQPLPDFSSWVGQDSKVLNVLGVADRELWLPTSQGSLKRLSLAELEGPVSHWKPTQLKVRQWDSLLGATRLYGKNSLFLDSGKGKCATVDAAQWVIRNPLNEANSQGEGPMETMWETSCKASTWAKYAINETNRLMLRLSSHGLEGFETTTGRLAFRYSPRDLKERMPSGTPGMNFEEVFPEDSQIQMDSKGETLGLRLGDQLFSFEIHAPHLEASWRSLFTSVQYEGYESEGLFWQSTSGNDDFQAKYSLWPLIWGTLKATLFSLFFAVPLGIFAAIYSSEILDRQTRNILKPTIEMMASLPSVVLGYIAAVIIAPWVEQHILSIVLIGLLTPYLLYFWGTLLVKNSARQISARGLYASRRLLVSVFFGFILSLFILLWAGDWIEKIAFAGDIRHFLTGGHGVESVLWGIFLLPIVMLALWGLPIPKYERAFKVAIFFVGPALSIGLGTLVSHWIERGDVFGNYAQRNTLIIAIAMGFAIIPIIYSLSEDALTSVPNSLRAASLAAGASVWQTTARIVIPTAASGLFSAVMVGLGRGIGETMIAVMATGNSPLMGINPFEGLRSLSANIAVELPEAPHGGTHYRVLFLSGLILLLFTFILNSFAEFMRARYRERNKAL